MLILNVLELPAYGNPEEPFAISANLAGFVKDLRKAHEGVLSKAMERATTVKPSIQVTTKLREGDPPSQIVAVADEGGFDAVVLGHGSKGRLEELFLGGTSERVAHLPRCIVMIVKSSISLLSFVMELITIHSTSRFFLYIWFLGYSEFY